MSNQEILTKAIEKAIAGGWNSMPWNGWGIYEYQVSEEAHVHRYDGDGSWVECPIETIIFNHDFAKALWGEKQGFNGVPVEAVLKIAVPASKNLSEGMRTVGDIFSMKSEPIWQWHLQQMVIADDPIDYLGSHLDD